MFKTRHLISPDDITLEEIDETITLAQEIIKNPAEYAEKCKGQVIASLFYEPSTRTRLSFETAMIRLGGNVIGFSDPNSTSAQKGESLIDTIKIVSLYANIAAIRHPKEGAPYLASKYSTIPVINAGDGGHHHPTQTLTDLLTIKAEKGSLSGFTIGLCGDLKFGRTVHSLVKALSRYDDIQFVFISPQELNMPEYVLNYVKPDTYRTVTDLEEVLPELDILYMTRIQKERFFNEEEYLKLKGTYILNKQKMKSAKESLMVMHPLPRVDEIAREVDSDTRALYFKQADYGIYMRMALILQFLLKV